MKLILLIIFGNNQYFKNSLEKLFQNKEKYTLILFDTETVSFDISAYEQKNTVLMLDFLQVNNTLVNLIRKKNESNSQLKFIFLSVDEALNYAEVVREFGFCSHVHFHDGVSELQKAIEIVFEGGTYISTSMTMMFENQLALARKNLEQLSEREKELLDFIKEGMTSKQIGVIIHKSHRTVDDLRKKLYLKLQVKNKTELLRLLADRPF